MATLPPGAILDSYARESRAKKPSKKRRVDRLSPSIEGQHAANLGRIKEYRAVLGKKLQDEGKSAWNPTVKRPGWEEIISRLESGASRGVVIFDIERFLRQMKDAVRIVEMAEMGFLIIDSDGEYDLTTPQGRKSFYDAASAAEYYSGRLSTRIKRGFKLMVQDGEWIGGRYRMFGFEPDATTVRESEAEHIRRVAPQLLRGREPSMIVQDLKELGVKHTTGNDFDETSLRILLVNPRLAGYIRRNGQIVGRLKGDPILDPTVWQQVVQWYAGRSGRPHSGAYLCSGQKALVCGDCGHTLSGHTDHGRRSVTHYDDGEPVRRYFCPKKYGGCGRVIGDQRILDRHLKELVLNVLADPEHMDQIKRRAQKEAKAREPIEAEIARLDGLRAFWGKELNAGRVTQDTYAEMTVDVAEQLAAQESKLEDLGTSTPAPDDELLNDAAANWEDAEGTERREMLRKALTGLRVEVDPGSVRDQDLSKRIRVMPAPRSKA